MSTTFTAALPLIEELKTHLADLKSATDEIAKATNAAKQSEEVAKQSQVTVNEVIGAAKRMVTAQEGLVEKLSQQQQVGLGEQELLLRVHAEELSNKTSEQTARQIDGLKQAATATQVLIDNLLQEQPQLLTAIREQHLRGIDEQQETLKKGVQTWADSLHQQMQTELKLLRQAIETLQKNTSQQHDELSAVANQLQVVAGRVTAFAEVMNAAKFTTRLESIEQQQKDTLADLAKSSKDSQATAARMTEVHEQQGADFIAELQRGQQQAADMADSHREAYEQRVNGLQGFVEQLAGQLAQAGQQQRLWQLVTLGAVVAATIVLFLK